MTTPKVAEIMLSNATLYYAPEGSSPPADTVAYGGSWGGSWARVGYTSAPLKSGYKFDSKAPDIQESIADVKDLKTHEELLLETVMAQIALGNFPLAWGGTTTVTPAGVGQPGKEEYAVGGERTLTVRAWGFEGEWIDDDGSSYPVRLFIWRATATEGGELEFGKEEYVGVPLKLKALGDLSKAKGQQLFKVQRITAPAS